MKGIDYFCFYSNGKDAKKASEGVLDGLRMGHREYVGVGSFYKSNVLDSQGEKFMEEMKNALKNGKALFISVINNKLYFDEDCTQEIIYLNNASVIIRCPADYEINAIRAVEEVGGKCLLNEEEHNRLIRWPDYVQPKYREAKLLKIKEAEEYIQNKLNNNLEEVKEIYLKLNEISGCLYTINKIINKATAAFDENKSFIKHKLKSQETKGKEITQKEEILSRNTASSKGDLDLEKKLVEVKQKMLDSNVESDGEPKIEKMLAQMKDFLVNRGKELDKKKTTNFLTKNLEKQIKDKIDLCFEKIEHCYKDVFSKLLKKFIDDKKGDVIYSYIIRKGEEAKKYYENQCEELFAKRATINKLFVKSCEKQFHCIIHGLKQMTQEEIDTENEYINQSVQYHFGGVGLKYMDRRNGDNAKYYDNIRNGLEDNHNFYKLITGYRVHAEKNAPKSMAELFSIGDSYIVKTSSAKNDLDLKTKVEEKEVSDIERILNDIKINEQEEEEYIDDFYIADENKELIVEDLVEFKTAKTNKSFSGLKNFEYRCFVVNGKVHSISSIFDSDDGVPDEVKQEICEFVKKVKKTSLPTTYVADFGIMIIDGKEVVDLVEMNSPYSSGRYGHNKIIS